MNPSTIISFSITVKTVHKNEKIGTDIIDTAIQEIDSIVSNSHLFKMGNRINCFMGKLDKQLKLKGLKFGD
ncbi:hypothetical protein EUGRSUZ_C02814 [Eucalyptus grandis]|uniref:Uncharacterized protein n=2 Tax=Eucalyptus grandis TaxID=71139 RepID=A0ACC3LH14_EUCGR|nr:hypothetical protein EUGRSUZ_C02814 [Eucalyptus grandis]